MSRSKHNIFRDSGGIAMAEFVVMLPILLAVMFGSVEMARLVLLNKKVNDFAQNLGDVMTQGSTISATTIDSYLANDPSMASRMMSPFAWNNGVMQVYVRSMARGVGASGTGGVCGATCTGNCWQRAAGALGTASQISATAGGCVQTPGNACAIQLASGEDIIGVEVNYRYEPILPYTAEIVPALTGRTLSAYALLRPRLNALVCLQ